MKEYLIDILKVVAPISVALIVFAQGLGIAPATVADYFARRPATLLVSLLAVIVVVPAAALALMLLLGPARGTMVGIAILVSCPPAPLMLKAVANVGHGNRGLLASLHLTLAAIAPLTVPATLFLLSQPLGFRADVDVGAMMWILAKTILIPLAAGIAFRGFYPAIADRIAGRLGMAGTIGLALVVLVALVALFPAILAMDIWSYAVVAAVGVVALGIGHFLGPDDPDEKTSLAVECATRHPVLALTIATANFGQERTLPVLVPCVLMLIAVAMVYMVIRGRTVHHTSIGAGAAR